MNILGLHAFSHDAGACLISEDGICAISEERLSRLKYDGGFPSLSIRYVTGHLDRIGLKHIDLIVFDRFGPPESKRRTIERLRRMGYRKEILCIDHHDAHAASAFFSCPDDKAAVLVIDGFGTSAVEDDTPMHPAFHLNHKINFVREVQSIYVGRGTRLHLLRRTFTTPHFQFGIGLLYTFASVFLGFGEMGAGKLMALAAYGGSNGLGRRPLLKTFGGEVLGGSDIGRDVISHENLAYYGRRLFRYSKPRTPEDPIRTVHSDIAHRAQEELERAVLHVAHDLHEVTRLPALCYSGGVALNCLTNSRLSEESGFDKLFIQPAATDSGIPLGCALYGYHVLGGSPRFFEMKDAFLGRAYGAGDVLSELRRERRVSFKRPDDLTSRVARSIAAGKIVGWFEGGAELGPRALGHRSILADPRSPQVKKRLDDGVKKREWFRPYAPSIMEDRAGDYFDMGPLNRSPFMLFAPKARDGKRRSIPAVVHVDGTSRVHTVNRSDQPRFHEILDHFFELSGIPLVLNTSLNRSGEPIVETPRDALDCFLNTDMDVLVLENYLCEKR